MKKETIDRIKRFTSERGWEQFYIPYNLARFISIEAGELTRCFSRQDSSCASEQIEEELANVLIYSTCLLEELGLDADEIVMKKMDVNEAKYPVR